jgi:hypothetical protein
VLGEILGWCAIGIVIFFLALRWYCDEKARYRPHLFTPIDASEFSPKMADYLARVTPELENLGYSRLSDYLLSEFPVRKAGRYFIDRNGKSLAEIGDIGGTLATEIWSVFDNGACLLSSEAPVRKLRYNPDQMILFNHLPGASFREVEASHWQRVAEYRETTGSHLLEFGPGDLREVTEYPRRLSQWNLHQRGLIPEPPGGRPREPETGPVAASPT